MFLNDKIVIKNKLLYKMKYINTKNSEYIDDYFEYGKLERYK